MEAYPTLARVFNLAVRPTLPNLVMTYEERRALSIARCRGKDKTPGRRRRWRREVQTKQSLAWLARLASGERVVVGGKGLRYSLQELLYVYVPSAARPLLAARAQARVLWQLAQETGPASGWGVRQPARDGAGAEYATPWWVSKASEKCWRWWRTVLVLLRRALGLLASWLSSVVPPHRAPLEQGHHGEEAEPTAVRASEGGTGCRDHSPLEVGRAPSWLRRQLGM